MNKVYFASDYQEGMAPEILKNLETVNLVPVSGYGTDEFSESARMKIRDAIGRNDAEIYFLAGGTQANAVVISAALREYEGVVAADTGHVALHEAGAIEFTGHKVLTVKGDRGILRADALRETLETFYADGNHDHMVHPGMVYISHPTEYGTLYSKAELTALRRICDAYHLPLYVDGARLAYALACKENDVSLKDLAELADAIDEAMRQFEAEQAAELAQTTEHTAPKEVPASKPKAATVLPTGMMAHTASDMKPRTDVQSSKAPKRKRRKPSSAPLPTPIIEGVQTTEVPSVMPLPQVSEKEMAQVERNFQQWQLRQTVLGEGIEMRMATERLNKKYEEYLAANKDNIEI